MRERPQDHAGDIAIVLHSHMPYVEGFGTYPFGEEWLFDAALRSYLPVLEVAESLTMTVTPVLADQLEAPGLGERLIEFTREFRVAATELDAGEMRTEGERAACRAEADRYRRALEALERLDGRLLGAFASAADQRGVELIPSSATHAILPLIATRGARRMQIESGIRSHERRFGPARGFWLPECAFEPGLEHLLAEGGVRYFCTDQTEHETEGAALRPARAGALTAFTLDWGAIQWLWSLEGYPSDPLHADFHRKSLRGARPWAIGGNPYDAGAAAARAREQAVDFARSAAARLRAHRNGPGGGEPGLLTFAIDTELLGHWWWEGPIWLEEVLRALPEHGVRPLTLGDAAAEHRPQRRRLGRSSWGEAKDLRTWDNPAVADLTWGARRLELRLLRELFAGRLRGPGLERAARELLAVQA
ncbi:MAG TPA: hypothetical protein VKA36_05355, partial [Solirubrobacterales bacterium]|nr:hypothetical protein [Solirubrobacterales bacterium]